ncbi:MAG: dihydrolipoyl dehydrogenase family protein [Chloroflexaceae bacterium]
MVDILVIGGGPAGVVAALRARELGATVALVERGELGGACVNDGCVPTRVLAKAARLVRDATQFPDYGISSVQPEVNFSRLLERMHEIVQHVHDKKQLHENLRQSGVELFTGVGDAHFVDEHTVALADGTRLQAEKFIICAGGHARRLPFPGSEHALTYNDIWALEKLPQTAVVVGGAATGCQLASILAAFGTRVTLLDVAPYLLPNADPMIADEIMAAFRGRGIEVITGISGIEHIEREETQLHCYYRRNGARVELPTEMVIVAAGWPGNVAALNVEAAHVRTERGYVVVDDYLQTSVPHIFAAGDITGRMMLVQSADHQGRIAAENAILGIDRTFASTLIPYGGFTDPEYAGVGLTEPQACGQTDCAVAVVSYADLDRAVIDQRTTGSLKLIVSRESRRILGAHVAGEQALEVVQIVAASMASGARVEQLANLRLAYPTFTAIVEVAARRLVRELGVVPLAPHWRDLRQLRVAEWERSLVQERPNMQLI